MTTKKLKDSEMSIIGQALADFNGNNEAEIIDAVSGTVVGINDNAMQVLVELMNAKKKMLKVSE